MNDPGTPEHEEVGWPDWTMWVIIGLAVIFVIVSAPWWW